MRHSLFAVAALLASSFAARADTVYTYTGQNFFEATGQYTTSDRVTGSFTVAAPFAAGFGGSFTPESFSFTDGVQTLNSGNTTSSSFAIYTGGDGDIIAYDIFLSAGLNRITSTSNDGSGNDEVGQQTVAASTAGTGTFTEQLVVAPNAVTPEPSSLALLSTGLLGIVGVMKRRFA